MKDKAVIARKRMRKLSNEVKQLRAAIERALADEESGTGWGPDVTVCAYLRDALRFHNPVNARKRMKHWRKSNHE